MAGAESFTVLAILEARDAASEIFAKVDESLDKFSETAKGAADSARDAGVAIDDALGRDVDVSDRLETATARLSHYVIPPKLIYERPDLQMWFGLDRRLPYPFAIATEVRRPPYHYVVTDYWSPDLGFLIGRQTRSISRPYPPDVGLDFQLVAMLPPA